MSMATEGRLGKARARDWPGVLRQILPASFWRAFLGAWEPVGDGRTHWSPKQVVLCWLLMGWLHEPGLGARFTGAWRTLAALFPRRRRPGRTYPGLLKSSQRIGTRALRQFLNCLRARLPALLGPLWTWYGWHVFAVDGSRVEAPRTRANQRALGQASRAGSGPQWWVTTLIHLPSRVLWDWRQGPGTASERGHLRQMLGRLPTGTLLLADAGFTGFALLGCLQRRGIDFLIRCGAHVHLLRDDSRARRAAGPEESQWVYLWPQRCRRQRPLRLRLIVLKRGRRRMYLLTNVLEPTRLPRRVAAELYAARWGIEVNYRSLKQTLERRQLQARTPAAGHWELAGNLLALALLLVQSAWLRGLQAPRASVAQLWRALRAALECLWWGAGARWYRRAVQQASRDDYVRRRSKCARDWRAKKREQPPGAPFLRRLTRAEKAQIIRWEHDAIRQVG